MLHIISGNGGTFTVFGYTPKLSSSCTCVYAINPLKTEKSIKNRKQKKIEVEKAQHGTPGSAIYDIEEERKKLLLPVRSNQI